MQTDWRRVLYTFVRARTFGHFQFCCIGGYTPDEHCVTALHSYTAIQRYTALYSAIHYTAIQRYTLYNLYNTPLDRICLSRISVRWFSPVSPVDSC